MSVRLLRGRLTVRSALLVALAGRCALGSPGTQVIDSMDDVRFHPTSEKAHVEPVDGKVGKAVRFTFDADARGVFSASAVHPTPDWDKAAGLSFWLKGDGSSSFGCLEFIWNEDYAVRYDCVFPLKSTEWTRIYLSWSDFVPVLPGPNSLPLNPRGGNAPSKLSGLWFGRWWYWSTYPAQSFAVDDIRLESTIHRDASPVPPSGRPMRRVLSKLLAGLPVTVVTMGDSLTDTRHWSNRESCWPNLLRDELQGRYRSSVRLVNPAIGGTQLRTNLVLMPTWLADTPSPDLVTVFFGGNDWDAGMRGPQFETTVADAIDRIRRATHNRADVLIVSTAPTVALWQTHAELAESCRRAARSRNAGLADVEQAFMGAGQAGRDRLFAWDKVHLSYAGQQLVARTVLSAIAGAGGQPR